jgi:hypothetical protein
MAKDATKGRKKARRDTRKSPPVAEHPPIIKSISVKPQGAKKWKIHSIEQQKRIAEKWSAHKWQARPSKPAKTAEKNPAGTKQRLGWQIDRINDVLPEVYPPRGRIPAEISHKQVQRDLEKALKKRGWTVPGVDTIARVRGRRRS